MPRKAREKVPFGTYYITQSCISEKELFTGLEDRQRFLDILMDKKRQFNFKLYGFCLKDHQMYRLIIYDNGSDISKIMKSINISITISLAGREKIFHERFKSKLIQTAEDLDGIINHLHDEEDCCSYLNHHCSDLIDRELYFTPPETQTEHLVIRRDHSDEVCMQISPCCQDTTQCIRDLSRGKKTIEEMAKIQNLSVEALLSDKKLRNKALLQFRRMTTLSMKDIGSLFGGLSESAVCKIISRNTNER